METQYLDWHREQLAADEVLLRCVGVPMSKCLPQLLALWTAATARDTGANEDELAFNLLRWVHEWSSADDRSSPFPAGMDVGVAREALDAVDALGDAAAADDPGSAYAAACLGVAAAAATATTSTAVAADDISTPEQLVLPVLLGFETPMPAADAAVVLKHLQHGCATTATKLAGGFCAAAAASFPIRVGYPCLFKSASLPGRLHGLDPKGLKALLRDAGLIGASPVVVPLPPGYGPCRLASLASELCGGGFAQM